MTRFPVRPDYTHSILNLSNSILADFGIPPYHATLPVLDGILAHGAYRHVVLLVCDAMGSMNLDELVPRNSFLLQHRKDSISSVFPPTTTAATTTLMSGLSPAQHGWLGWQPFFPQLNDAVELFPNNIPDRLTEASGGTHARITHPDEHPPFSAGGTLLPYRSNIGRIAETENVLTALYAPFLSEDNPNRVHEFRDITAAILGMSARENRTYTYAYWPEPDGTMHRTGVTSGETHSKVEIIDRELSVLAHRLTEQEKVHREYGKTLVIVTADHGHIDNVGIDINEYTDILDMLTSVPSLEPRAVAFFVKSEYQKIFPAVFFSHFSRDDFLLLPKTEFLTGGLIGPVTQDIPQNVLVGQMAGDFIAIATGSKSIFNSAENAAFHKGMHSGLSEKELSVPLIVF